MLARLARVEERQEGVDIHRLGDLLPLARRVGEVHLGDLLEMALDIDEAFQLVGTAFHRAILRA